MSRYICSFRQCINDQYNINLCIVPEHQSTQFNIKRLQYNDFDTINLINNTIIVSHSIKHIGSFLRCPELGVRVRQRAARVIRRQPGRESLCRYGLGHTRSTSQACPGSTGEQPVPVVMCPPPVNSFVWPGSVDM